MLQDIESTPTYQRLTKKGREEGLVKGRIEGQVEGMRQAVLELVQTRFPALRLVAQTQLEPITSLELLRQAITRIGSVRTDMEVLEYLKGLSEPEV